MNELQTFANNEFGAVRSMMIGDVPRFVGRDVAVALGYSNPRKTLGVRCWIVRKQRPAGKHLSG